MDPEANPSASSDDEVKGTGKPRSVVVNETKSKDESRDSNDDNSSDYQSSGRTDDVGPQYLIKSVLRNDVDTNNESDGATPPNGDTVTGVTRKNKSTIEPANPVERNEVPVGINDKSTIEPANPIERNEAPVDHNENDTGIDAKDENETGYGAENEDSYETTNEDGYEAAKGETEIGIEAKSIATDDAEDEAVETAGVDDKPPANTIGAGIIYMNNNKRAGSDCQNNANVRAEVVCWSYDATSAGIVVCKTAGVGDDTPPTNT
jgi:hypothetical protein